MGGLGSPFNYKVITGNMPSLFEKRLNKAMEDGCTVLQSTFRLSRCNIGITYSILVMTDKLPLKSRNRVIK